ncbi:aspartic peptidase domain-containing protein [Melampsora americana]|nr:aspartic peptidase domain-containing protein [Melampsora americana]
MRKRVESLSLSFNESILRRRDLPLSPKGNSSNGYPQSSFHALNNSTITSAATPTAKNSIGLSIEANDVGYFAEISVGTPPKKFKIILDSGSADTWLMCRNLQDQALACNHPTLNPSSSTLRTTNTKFKVSYGTGSVQGFLVQEDITIGGLVLPHHTFGGVTLASNEFSGPTIPFDGLMGTAKTSLSSQKVITPIEAMAKAGIISGAFIGYSLGRVSDNQNIGQATFGGVDQTKFSGNLTMFPNVSKKGFWEGEMATILVDGQVVLTQRTGILDTGTTLIVAPPADAQALHDRIPGASSDGKGGFFIPCTSKAKVALSFGGVVFEINPGDLTFQPTTTNLSGKCISGISSGTIGGPRQWLLGDTFLKNVYFATDATHDEIGMAVLKKVSSKG